MYGSVSQRSYIFCYLPIRSQTSKTALEKLPLEMFDDADEFETRSGDEWVELGPSLAAAAAAAASTTASTASTGTGTGAGSGTGTGAGTDASIAASAPAGKPTTGRSLFYLHPHFVWLPCEVLAWDADQQRFLVSFFSEAEMRASKDMQPALEELVQVRRITFWILVCFSSLRLH